MWPYVSSKRTEFTFGQWRAILAVGGAVMYLSVFLLNTLGRDTICGCSEGAVLWMKLSL